MRTMMKANDDNDNYDDDDNYDDHYDDESYDYD